MGESHREILESKKSIWARVFFYNIFIGIAIYIGVREAWLYPLAGIRGMGDLAGFVALLVFIFLTWKETAMLFYDVWAKRERQEGHRQGRQEREEELRQGIAQVFADDRDALEKLDKFFNGHNDQK